MDDETSIDLHYLEPKIEIQQDGNIDSQVLENTLNNAPVLQGVLPIFDHLLGVQNCYLCNNKFVDWISLHEHAEKDHIGKVYDVAKHFTQYRTNEQENDRERQRIRRLNPEYRMLEQEKNRERQRLRRLDPIYKVIEKEKNRQRQKIRRMDPEYREVEKERNRARQRNKRQNINNQNDVNKRTEVGDGGSNDVIVVDEMDSDCEDMRISGQRSGSMLIQKEVVRAPVIDNENDGIGDWRTGNAMIGFMETRIMKK